MTHRGGILCASSRAGYSIWGMRFRIPEMPRRDANKTQSRRCLDETARMTNTMRFFVSTDDILTSRAGYSIWGMRFRIPEMPRRDANNTHSLRAHAASCKCSFMLDRSSCTQNFVRVSCFRTGKISVNELPPHSSLYFASSERSWSQRACEKLFALVAHLSLSWFFLLFVEKKSISISVLRWTFASEGPLSISVLRKRTKQKASSTLRASQAVPHPSTDRALQRLTSEFGRDLVYSLRYGR